MRKFKIRALRLLSTTLILMSTALAVHAQDSFEIQVYEYETVPKGMWNLETHINFTGKGTKFFEGPAAPTNHQFHLTFELRPIIEKKLGRWQLDFNPVIARALRGPGKKEGWEFEPGVRIGYGVNEKLDLSLEYYGATGPLGEPLPRGEQVHQFYPGWDWNFSENVVWNFGIGVGVTEAGNRLVYKSRIGYLFGKKRN